MKRIRAWKAAGTAILIAAALTACNSGDSAADNADPIKISVILATGTSNANWDEMLSGARAAARAINAEGGVKGRQIEIDYCNEKNDPNQAAACARKAESSDDIAIVGLESTYAIQSVLPSLRTIPNIGPMALSDAEITCATCYAYDGSLFAAFGAGPYLAKLVGIKSVVNVTQDIPIAHTTTKQTEDALRAAGVQVAGSLYLPPTTSDMAPWAQKVIESGAEAVNPALSHQQVYALLQALQQLGKPIPVIGNDNELTLPDLKSLGSFVDGANIVMTLPPATSTHIRGVKMFVDDMAAQEKSGDKYAANVGSAAQHTWLGVRIVAKIASQAKGTVDRESFTAALQSAKDVDLFGILPPWTPSSKAPAGAPEGMVNPFVYFTKVKNEQFVLVNEDPYNIATNTFVKINP